jgi:SAM-dependent methyltransferase
MKRKKLDEKYFSLQDARSDGEINQNSIRDYLKHIPIKITPELTVLDIGCRSKAYTVNLFHKLGCKSFGIDIGERAEKGWSKLPFKDNLKRADIHNGVPFDIKFDIISISHTLEHCHDPDKVISNIFKALKPGGYVWSIVPLETSDAHHDPHYCVFHSEQEHIDIWKKGGFQISQKFTNAGSSWTNSLIWAIKPNPSGSL